MTSSVELQYINMRVADIVTSLVEMHRYLKCEHPSERLKKKWSSAPKSELVKHAVAYRKEMDEE